MTPKEFTFDAAYQPQVRAKRGTREIMLDVIIALLPALCVGVWQFGAQALIPLAVSVVSCVFFEWAYRKLLKKPDSIGDLSAVVTGILLAYTLPANCKWWLPIIGAFFAIVVVKQLYGGIGKNFLNPALAGRAFLLASYALFMTTWVVPGSLAGVVDAETMATPLSYMKAGEALPQYFTLKSMFLGTMQLTYTPEMGERQVFCTIDGLTMFPGAGLESFPEGTSFPLTFEDGVLRTTIPLTVQMAASSALVKEIVVDYDLTFFQTADGSLYATLRLSDVPDNPETMFLLVPMEKE